MKNILGIDCYTTKEVANILDITVPTTLEMYKAGRIKATRIGYSYYVSEKNLAAFINKEEQGGNIMKETKITQELFMQIAELYLPDAKYVTEDDITKLYEQYASYNFCGKNGKPIVNFPSVIKRRVEELEHSKMVSANDEDITINNLKLTEKKTEDTNEKILIKILEQVTLIAVSLNIKKSVYQEKEFQPFNYEIISFTEFCSRVKEYIPSSTLTARGINDFLCNKEIIVKLDRITSGDTGYKIHKDCKEDVNDYIKEFSFKSYNGEPPSHSIKLKNKGQFWLYNLLKVEGLL